MLLPRNFSIGKRNTIRDSETHYKVSKFTKMDIGSRFRHEDRYTRALPCVRQEIIDFKLKSHVRNNPFYRYSSITYLIKSLNEWGYFDGTRLVYELWNNSIPSLQWQNGRTSSQNNRRVLLCRLYFRDVNSNGRCTPGVPKWSKTMGNMKWMRRLHFNFYDFYE